MPSSCIRAYIIILNKPYVYIHKKKLNAIMLVIIRKFLITSQIIVRRYISLLIPISLHYTPHSTFHCCTFRFFFSSSTLMTEKMSTSCSRFLTRMRHCIAKSYFLDVIYINSHTINSNFFSKL